MEKHKLAVIRSNGEIDRRGDRSEDLLHVKCLLEFIKEKYPNNPTLGRLTDRHTANTVGFFLTLYGNVIVFNTTKHEEKYGKSGFVMVPSGLNEAQKRSLEEVLGEMSDYSVTIAYDLKVVDGIVEDKEISSTEKIPPLKLLEIFYKRLEEVERKVK